jgi:hypothetical protein
MTSSWRQHLLLKQIFCHIAIAQSTTFPMIPNVLYVGLIIQYYLKRSIPTPITICVIISETGLYWAQLSYYKCMCVCVCVCVCVCLSVCPAIRFHSSQRIFSTCSGNVLSACACYTKPIIASGSFIVTVYWTVMSTPNGRTNYLQICWERTSTHHKCSGLRTCHIHAPCARLSAC